MGKRNGKGGAAIQGGAATVMIHDDREEATDDLGGAIAEIASMIDDTEVPAVRRIPLHDLAESPRNRRHYNDADLDELAASLRATGQTTPIIVRPLGEHGSGPFEIAAGHRRFRAAKRAGLGSLIAVVRPMDDATFLEVLAVENLQREDIHDLDQAEIYAQMQLDLGWDVARIAKRVKKSETYVYDSLALRTLIEPVRELFFAERFSRAIAVELARLTSEQQAMAINPDASEFGSLGGGLWQPDQARYDSDQFDTDLDDASRDPYAGLKAVSVLEFKRWVRRECRLDPAAASLAIDFPETAAELEAAEVKAEPMVEITALRKLTPEQRAGSKVLTEDKWRESEAGACEHTVRGFHSIGPDRGAVQYVCPAKRKCRTHWGPEIRAAEQAAKAKESGGNGATEAERGETPAQRKQREKMEKERAAAEAQRAAMLHAMPAIIDASLVALGKVSPVKLAQQLLADAPEIYGDDKAILARVKGKDLAALVRRLWLTRKLEWDSPFDEHNAADILPAFAKDIGLDLPKVLKANQPPPVLACVYCGCTEDNACEDGCGWAAMNPPRCDSADCLEKHRAALAAKKKAAKKKGKRA